MQRTWKRYSIQFADHLQQLSSGISYLAAGRRISLVETSLSRTSSVSTKLQRRSRNEAGEQLRDLNIRIALAASSKKYQRARKPVSPLSFFPDDCDGGESLGANPDLNTVLIEQVPKIFRADCGDLRSPSTRIWHARNCRAIVAQTQARRWARAATTAGRGPPSMPTTANIGDDGFQATRATRSKQRR